MVSKSFTKLFASITDSSLWSESNETRIVWITMLAMADANGYVGASILGLAARARVSVADTEAALAKFLGPDPYSRTRDNEGRRIAEADGGWTLLNYKRHRDFARDESAKESRRLWAAKDRARRAAKVDASGETSPPVELEWRSPSVSVSDPPGSRSDPDPDLTRARDRHEPTPEPTPEPPPPPPGVFEAPTLTRSSTVAPDDFEPTDTHRVRCKELRIDVATELRNFKLFEFSRPYANWNLRFSRWIEDARIRAETERGKRKRDRPNQPYCGLTGFEGATEVR